ncbi:MAG: hypothetical protein WCB74_26135 [Pseudolabrys sp.]
MNRREFFTSLIALPALVRPASAEVSTINLGKQYGLPFLPQMVMEDHKLIEAQAARLGINGLKIGWLTMGGPGALNDGLLAGQIQFVNVASPSLATLWDKTFGTPQEVRAVCTVQSMPYVLTTLPISPRPTVSPFRPSRFPDKLWRYKWPPPSCGASRITTNSMSSR